MPDVPGSHAYDVIYRATADFTDLFAEVAAAKAAMEELKESTDETNSSSEEGAKAAADAEKARTDAMKDASKAAKEYEQQQLLLNKAENNGFNTPQEAKAFQDQNTQSKNLANLAENDGRQTRALATQDLKDQTAAFKDRNASLAEYNDTVEESAKAFQDANSASHDLDSGLSDIESGAKDSKQAVDDVGQSLDDFSAKAESTGNTASQTGSLLEGMGNGASAARKGIDDVNQSLSESAKAFLEYQQAQKDANAALNETPTTSLSGALGTASNDIEAAMRAQAAETAAENLSRNHLSQESLITSAQRNASNNVSTGIFSAESLSGAKSFAEEVKNEVTPSVEEAGEAIAEASKASDGLSDSFEGSTAQGVLLSIAMNKLDNDISSLSTDVSNGFYEGLSKRLKSLLKDFSTISKAAQGLDDPAARQWIKDTDVELDSMALQFQSVRSNINEVGSEFKSSGEEADNFGTVLSKVNSASAVILANNLEDIENKLVRMHTDLEAGGNDWDTFATSIAKTNTQLNAATKQAVALDDPAAKDAVNELKDAFNSLSMQALASKDDLDVFTASETKNSAASVLLTNSLDNIRAKIDAMKASMQSGGSTWDSFAASLAKANTQLTAASKQAAALDDPESRNAVGSLQLALNGLSVEALKSKDNISVFKSAEDAAADSAKKVTSAVKDTKKAADDASLSYKIFGQGLKDISGYFADLSAQTKAEGGSGGFLGFLGSFFGGGLSGISAIFGGLAATAGSVLPLILGLATAIPAVVTGIVGLAGAVVGLIGALSPLIGFLATLLPIALGMAEAVGVLYLAIKPLIAAVEALNSATTNSGVSAALKGLSPTMQKAAEDIHSFIKALTGAKGALKDIGTDVFAPLLGSLGQLKAVIEPVEEALNTMAGAVGKSIQPVLAGFIAFLRSADFQTLTKAAAESLVYFGGTVANFLTTLGMLATAAAPYTVIIAKWFDTFTKGMKDVTGATIANGGVNQFFQQMITALQEIGSIAYEVGRTFDLWGSGLAPIGNFILVGIAKGFKDIADAANKVDFTQWDTDIEKFLSGLKSAFSGIASILAALVNNKFLPFLGDVLTDIGNIARALAPIVKFFTDIVVGALPTMKRLLDDISGVIVDILKPIDSFLDKVEQNKDAMKGLSDVFSALATLVVAGSVISFFTLLAGLAGKGFSGVIDLVNKIPGINLPGGSGGKGGASSGIDTEAITTNATENATRIVEAIMGEGGESAAGGAAGGAEGAVGAEAGAAGIGVTATIAGIVTAVLAFLGAGFLIYEIIHGVTDPKSTIAKANDWVTAHDGANWWDKNVAKPVENNFDKPVGHFFTGSTEWEKDSSKAIDAFFTGSTGWEKAGSKAIDDFFTGNAGWEKSSSKAIDDFFTGNNGWEKAGSRAISDFFTGNNGWEKASSKALDDFFTGNAQWEKTSSQDINNFFKGVASGFARDVYDPVKNWVTGDFVGFFTNSVARWFTTAGSWFVRDVYDPIKNWAENDIPGFFTSTVPKWFESAGSWFARDVYDPIKDFVLDGIPGFFTSSIPNWFGDVENWFIKQVTDPINSYFLGTGSDSLLGNVTSGFKAAINSVITNVFNNGLISILNDALGVVGLKIPKIPTFAAGGHVQGNLGEPDNSDSVWAKLTPGEFVIRKRAAAALGPDTLSRLNQADKGFAGHFSGGGPVGQGSSAPQGSNGGLLSGVESLLGGVVDWASSFVSGALKTTFDAAYKFVVDPILSELPTGTVPTGMAGLAAGSVKSAVDAYLGAQDAKADASATGSLGGSIPTGGQLSIIMQALKAAGVANNSWPVWETGLNTLIMRESGWNPNAVNRTDSNAAAGNPSEGLAQTTGTTFQEFHVAGTSNNILDPVANVAAAIKYIEATYGSIQNVQQANANAAPKGYATGGFVGDPTLGMGFAAAPFGMAGTAGTPSLKSQAGMNASGRLSGPGVHVENLNISNPIPEQSGDSLQRAMTRLRVYDGHGS